MMEGFLSLCRENCPPAKTRLQCFNSNQGHLTKFRANWHMKKTLDVRKRPKISILASCLAHRYNSSVLVITHEKKIAWLALPK